MIQDTCTSSTLRFSRFAALALLALARTANAVPIIHGNFPGTNVDYLAVQEESATDPGVPLFGPPTVTGNTIDFNPVNFAATTAGVGADTTDSNLRFTIMAKGQSAINNVMFSEAGDTTLTGLSGEANTTVGTSVFMEITEVRVGNVFQNVNLNVPVGVMTFSPKKNFLRTVDGTGQITWTGALTLNLAPTLAANGINGVATKVFVTLNNTLSASSVLGTSAFIQKKDADGVVIIVNIPEPASIVTSLIALVFGGGMLRRRA